MLFGLMCGELLRSSWRPSRKLLTMIVAGLSGLAVGYLLDYTGICPLVKRIWTPSWTLFSTGWCLLILAGLYLVIDWIGLRFWAWPLVVVGVNSIAIYCMEMLLGGWTARTFKTHLGEDIFSMSRFGEPWHRFGELWQPTVQAVSIGLMYWVVCLWMYRRKVFVRI